MLLVKLHFTPALLLLMLSLAPRQDARLVPVLSRGSMTQCVSWARTLLQNITEALSQKNLFSGINCTEQSVVLNTETDITSVCAPKEIKCTGHHESEFSEESCLTNIGQDLLRYYQFLAVQPDPDAVLGRTVLFSLRELIENCFAWARPTELASMQASTNRPSTFDERLTLCKVLKGFKVRAITVNRVIGYLNSGEHTK